MSNLKLDFAKELRKNQTSAEIILWRILRRKNIEGLKFKRQVVIGPFIADFYCHALKLVIEVDGGIHFEADQQARDTRRQAWLEAEGYRVIRFLNTEVMSNSTGVVKAILNVQKGLASE